MKRISGITGTKTAAPLLLCLACTTSSGDGDGSNGGESTVPPGPGQTNGGSGTSGSQTGGSGSSTGSTAGSGTTSSGTAGSSSGGSGTTGSATGSTPVFMTPVNVGNGDGGINLSECAAVSIGAERIYSPVDIIFIIDNSSSMDGEIRQVQERINADFAEIIEATGVDYRVIMISRYGEVGVQLGESDNPICIRAPLGAGDCTNPNQQTLVNNPPKFFHYSADIRSREPFCDVLESWDTSDELTLENERVGNWPRPSMSWDPIAPIGWRLFVRESAFKHFVVITDDDVYCDRGGFSFDDGAGQNRTQGSTVEGGIPAAQAFDAALRALEPRQFGTAEYRKYKWHSIVGMVQNEDPTEPWGPEDPIQTEECGDRDDSDGPGTGYQALSVLTGGLRWPTCNNDNFNAIFQALAEGVILGSLSCEWEIPPVEDGETFDPNEVNVSFTSGAGQVETFPAVGSAAECGSDRAWYYDDPADPHSVIACPATCDYIKPDPAGVISVVFGCETQRILR